MTKLKGKKHVPSIIKTKASKEYQAMLVAADKTVAKYSSVVSRAVGKSKEEIGNEIQAIYLDNLRRADDIQALAKENIVNLMLKKQTSDYLREHMYKRALAEAEAADDTEEVAKIEAGMINDLMLDDDDLKIFNAINGAIKTIKSLEPRIVSQYSNMNDDNITFTVVEAKSDK